MRAVWGLLFFACAFSAGAQAASFVETPMFA